MVAALATNWFVLLVGIALGLWVVPKAIKAFK